MRFKKWLLFLLLLAEPVLVFDFSNCLPFDTTVVIDGQVFTSRHECVATSRNNERNLLPIGTHLYFINYAVYGLGGREERLEGWITGYQCTWTLDGFTDDYIIRYYNQTGTVPLMKEFVLDAVPNI